MMPLFLVGRIIVPVVVHIVSNQDIPGLRIEIQQQKNLRMFQYSKLNKFIEKNRYTYQQRGNTKDFKSFGIKSLPLWDIEPSRFIIPLLHVEIGLVNKLWSQYNYFLRDKVDYINNIEHKMRTELNELQNLYDVELKKFKVSDEQLNAVKTQQSNLEKQMKDIETRIHTFQESTGDYSLIHQFVAIQDIILSIKLQSQHTIQTIKSQKKNTKASLSSLKKRIQNLNTKIKKSMEERVDNQNRLDFIIEQVLKKRCRIYPQSFHGEEINGVCCHRLLDNIPYILEYIKNLAVERVSKQKDKNMNRCSLQRLTYMFDQFWNIFWVLDNLFSLLCIPGPNENEIDDIKENIIVLEKLWNDLNISVTPKAHVLFDHTLSQVIEFGGIADKVEDYVEKAH